jgi:hypothetical protein
MNKQNQLYAGRLLGNAGAAVRSIQRSGKQ